MTLKLSAAASVVGPVPDLLEIRQDVTSHILNTLHTGCIRADGSAWVEIGQIRTFPAGKWLESSCHNLPERRLQIASSVQPTVQKRRFVTFLHENDCND